MGVPFSPMSTAALLHRVLAVVPTLFDWIYFAVWFAEVPERVKRWLSLFLRWRLVSRSFLLLLNGNAGVMSPIGHFLFQRYPMFDLIRWEDHSLLRDHVKETGTYDGYKSLAWLSSSSYCDKLMPLSVEQFRAEHRLWTMRAPRPYDDSTLMMRRKDLSPRDFISLIVRYNDITYQHSGWAATDVDIQGRCRGCFKKCSYCEFEDLCESCTDYESSLLVRGPGNSTPAHCNPRDPSPWMTSPDRKRWHTPVEEPILRSRGRKQAKLTICADPLAEYLAL